MVVGRVRLACMQTQISVIVAGRSSDSRRQRFAEGFVDLAELCLFCSLCWQAHTPQAQTFPSGGPSRKHDSSLQRDLQVGGVLSPTLSTL